MQYNQKTAAAMLKKVMRAAAKNDRPTFAKFWTDADGFTCVSDTFRAYRVAASPFTPEDYENAHTTDAPVDLASFFKATSGSELIEIPAPDLDAIKAFIKQDRATHAHKDAYHLGDGLPYVNMVYIKEMVQLFPAAKWYVYADPKKRMIKPVFAICEEGQAIVCPVRVFDEQPAAPVADPAPAADPTPAAPQRPATIPASETPWKYDYFIYSRPAGAKRFLLTNIHEGTVGLNKMYAPRYKEMHLERIKEMLDLVAAENPGAIFQLRKLDGKRVVYTGVPTFTPEAFAATVAA